MSQVKGSEQAFHLAPGLDDRFELDFTLKVTPYEVCQNKGEFSLPLMLCAYLCMKGRKGKFRSGLLEAIGTPFCGRAFLLVRTAVVWSPIASRLSATKLSICFRDARIFSAFTTYRLSSS